MIEFPLQLSPLGAPDGALADGPFVVETTTSIGTSSEIGFQLEQRADGDLQWLSTGHPQVVAPTSDPIASGESVEIASGDAKYLFRPLELGDAAIVDMPDAPGYVSAEEKSAATKALAQTMHDRFYDGLPEIEMGEENLYLTRNSDGSPLALVKMNASHPTLVRRNGAWDVLGDEEDNLLGNSDIPVRSGAVSTWDAGDLKKLEDLLLDDRFSPVDVTDLWVELDGDTDKIKRLLIQRSRDRFYERTTHGTWAPAAPDDGAVTLDVVWSAIGAWDDGNLTDLGEAQQYDEEGDAA